MKRAKGFELEVIANKRPPFGANLQAAVQVCALTCAPLQGLSLTRLAQAFHPLELSVEASGPVHGVHSVTVAVRERLPSLTRSNDPGTTTKPRGAGNPQYTLCVHVLGNTRALVLQRCVLRARPPPSLAP